MSSVWLAYQCCLRLLCCSDRCGRAKMRTCPGFMGGQVGSIKPVLVSLVLCFPHVLLPPWRFCPTLNLVLAHLPVLLYKTCGLPFILVMSVCIFQSVRRHQCVSPLCACSFGLCIVSSDLILDLFTSAGPNGFWPLPVSSLHKLVPNVITLCLYSGPNPLLPPVSGTGLDSHSTAELLLWGLLLVLKWRIWRYSIIAVLYAPEPNIQCLPTVYENPYTGTNTEWNSSNTEIQVAGCQGWFKWRLSGPIRPVSMLSTFSPRQPHHQYLQRQPPWIPITAVITP